MAQKQFTTFQESIYSFDLREAMLGILRGGRYSGYNALNYSGGQHTLIHTEGIRKLPKGMQSLSTAVGVALTTQGVIIHEDQPVNIQVPLGNTSDSVFVLVYMQHEYQGGVPGSNPATYGTVVGSEGGGIPALPQAYRRVIIGTLEVKAGATVGTGLVWNPSPSEDLFGDTKLFQNLFGSKANFEVAIMGAIPSDGVIGNRKYTENKLLTDEESITKSLDRLDMSIGDLVIDNQDLMNRALDDPGWAQLTDNTNQNATALHHGLLPKLSDDESEFLNGKGQWTGFPDSLLAANNLSDIEDPAEARKNLGIATPQEIEESFLYDTGWQNLIPGAKISPTNYNMKFRRVGKMGMVMGYFTFSGVPTADEVLFKFNLALPPGSLPDIKIYGSAFSIQTSGTNRGFSFYIHNLPFTSFEVNMGPTGFIDSAILGQRFYINTTYIVG